MQVVSILNKLFYGVVMQTLNKPIWSKQPNETMKSFQAFEKYLSMGINRSLGKVCQYYTENRLKKKVI